MPFGIGPLELILVLVIILVIFGPKRLPGVGRSLGQGMREFKDSVTGKDRDDEAPETPELHPAADRTEGSPATTAGAARSDDTSRAVGRDD